MTSAQWGTVSVIVTIVGGIATIYYLRLSATREAARMREQEKRDAISEAERPLKAEIAAHIATLAQLRVDHAAALSTQREQHAVALSTQREQHREQVTAVRDACAQQVSNLTRTIDRRDDTIAALTARVDVLEDELRRGRGHGDNDAARQPPNG